MSTYTQPDGSLICWTVFNHHEAGEVTPVRTGLRWTPTDPFAVHVEFIARNTIPVGWYLSRDTLLDGMGVPSGDGDVKVFRASPDWVAIHLSSPSGHAQFSVEAETLRNFLSLTCHHRPRGDEYLGCDIDAELAAWLTEDAA